MDAEEFRARGKEMVDFISNYLETVEKRDVIPKVEPNWLKDRLPLSAPNHPESFCQIMKDFNEEIMPGITHWQHPNFHGYFPLGISYPSILGDMLCNGLGILSIVWEASPSCTELETIVMDWLGRAVGLPEEFLSFPQDTTPKINGNAVNGESGSKKPLGGGVLQGSASDCIFACMMAARARTIKYLKKKCPLVDECVILSKLVVYCSKEAHSCVEKNAMMSFVKLRILDVDKHNSLRGDILKRAMDEDRKLGFVPFFVSTTLGTTSCCSFDNLVEVGSVCKEPRPMGKNSYSQALEYPPVWLHVDGAYAGSAFICPEFREYMKGIEYADSFNINANKWLLCLTDAACMWVKDRDMLTESFVVDPLYLHSNRSKVVEYRHWGISLTRRFRALKLWFVLRCYGIEKLQKYIRNHCALAQSFKDKILGDEAFELCNDVRLGLVCFRLKDNDPKDALNKKFLELILKTKKLHMVPAIVQNKYVIRFSVNAEHAKEADIEYAWSVIKAVSLDPELQTDTMKSGGAKVTVTSDVFDEFTNIKTQKPERALRYTLKSECIKVQIISYGATVTSISVPDKKGKSDDVVLGFDTMKGILTASLRDDSQFDSPEVAQYARKSAAKNHDFLFCQNPVFLHFFAGYQGADNPYFGATVGRYANRIGNARFQLDNETYNLAANIPSASLHGGLVGFDKVNWNSYVEDDSVIFTYLSMDGEEGYPGDLLVTVKYRITNMNRLQMTYEAVGTKKTVVNLTNHSYFNLAGHQAGADALYGHAISVNADKITAWNEYSVTTGELKHVGGTPYDFRTPKNLGQAIKALSEKGFDVNFCLNNYNPSDTTRRMIFVARVLEPKSGRTLEIHTNQPGVQFYTSNYLNGVVGKGSTTYNEHGAFCLETQSFPNSVNIESFPSSVLKPGHKYFHETWLTFDVECQ